MSIVDDARRRRIRQAVRHAKLARAQRSRRRTEVRRASSGRPPVCASATTARHPRHVPAGAGAASCAAAPSLARHTLYHRRRAVKWPATDTDYWCACRRCIAASRLPARRHRVEWCFASASGHEWTIFVATLSSKTTLDPFLLGNDR